MHFIFFMATDGNGEPSSGFHVLARLPTLNSDTKGLAVQDGPETIPTWVNKAAGRVQSRIFV
jgi:hypothetical protein